MALPDRYRLTIPNFNPEVGRELSEVIRSIERGVNGLPFDQPLITDASTNHTIASFSDTKAALDALGVKINLILDMLQAAAVMEE